MENRPANKVFELHIGIPENTPQGDDQLKINFQLLKMAIESTSDAIGMATPDGNHFYQNQAFEKLFEYSLEEINPIGVKHAIYNNQKDADMIFHEIMAGKPWTGEVKMKSKTGRNVLISLRADAIRCDEGKIIGLIGIHRDVTERKKAEKALQLSEKRFRDVTNCTGDWIWEVDKKGRYTFCSERVFDSLGYTAEELLGKTPFRFMPKNEAERVSKIFKKMVGNRDPIINLENWNIKRNGDKTCLLTNALPNINEKGELIGYRGIDKDITQRKSMESKLLAREAELEQKSFMLEEHNTALKVLLHQRDRDLKEMEEKIIANLKEMVFPFLDTLKAGQLSKKQHVCLNIVQSYLDDIAAPFMQKLSSRYSDLTPTEIKIAALIKNGKSTKEIAEVMGSSANAVKFHRAGLRRKFGLLNKKTNLRVHLSLLSE